MTESNDSLPCDIVLSSSASVLSVQSHVVSGCVGNRAAVFPLQLLGFDTDFINSVQFSNHTQYPVIKGKVLDGSELSELKDALQANDLLSHNYLLTGYIGSNGFLSNVLDLLTTMESLNPETKYVCDPVLGDHGRYYVPQDLVSIFRESVIPRAYMITPNQFEAELLTETTISSEEEVVAAVISLLALGPRIVVLTSAEFPASPTYPEGKLYCYCAKRVEGEYIFVRVTVDKVDGHFTGTGDCTAALMLAWIHRTGEDIGQSLLNTMATMQGVLGGVTMTDKNTADPLTRARLLRCSELAVIHGKPYIENPPVEEFGKGLDNYKTWIVPC